MDFEDKIWEAKLVAAVRATTAAGKPEPSASGQEKAAQFRGK